MSKVKSSTPKTFVKGGNTKMHSYLGAGPQTPSVSGSQQKSGGGKFASGGSTHMFGKQTAKPAKAC